MSRRCSAKFKNVQGKGEPTRGNKGKSIGEEGKVVAKEGEGISDVVLRHWCTFEAVCSLNYELEDCQKLAVERTVCDLLGPKLNLGFQRQSHSG